MHEQGTSHQGFEQELEALDREDAKWQQRVLSLVLSEQPRALSQADITRELLGEHVEFSQQDELIRAIRELANAGLVHLVEHLVFPTRAALLFHDLELE